jgi:hypothetical protein
MKKALSSLELETKTAFAPMNDEINDNHKQEWGYSD